ncbi:CMRF35-like molecule 3 [Hoplias malabaricus]|uniref:CMRF35-like molecule 3 n=1 Tax=Hoplias malabaricus TaxID=27720 RepID=UPI003462FF69
MIIFLLLLFEKIAGDLTGPKEVKECAGRSIHITCQYHPFYRNNVKYWCKGYYFNFCQTLIRTDQSAQPNGPVTIEDNKTQGFFIIHMKDVKQDDTGLYWCGIERVSRHVYIYMEIAISPENAPQCLKPTTQHPVKETTTLPVTTTRLTTPETTETTWTTQETSSTSDLTYINPEAITKEITFTESLVYKLWTLLRWILFFGLCSFLLSFTLYIQLRQRRD